MNLPMILFLLFFLIIPIVSYAGVDFGINTDDYSMLSNGKIPDNFNDETEAAMFGLIWCGEESMIKKLEHRLHQQKELIKINTPGYLPPEYLNPDDYLLQVALYDDLIEQYNLIKKALDIARDEDLAMVANQDERIRLYESNQGNVGAGFRFGMVELKRVKVGIN